jgi:uncharacterized Ntn-hydrolase superfamily protein
MQEENLFDSNTFNGVPTENIEQLFTFWKDTFNKRASTVLDEARKKKIAAALKAYGMDTCKKAILGCSLSKWHTGQNPHNKQYTDLTLIFRNADKVEAFVGIWEQETQGQKEMDQWLNS